MGSNESRLGFRRAIVQLETGNRGDDQFWDNFWRSDGVDCASDVWALVPSSEVRALREEFPSSLATLCYKGTFFCTKNLLTNFFARKILFFTTFFCIKIFFQFCQHIFIFSTTFFLHLFFTHIKIRLSFYTKFGSMWRNLYNLILCAPTICAPTVV
mgnify:CR=1 FL=1